MNIDVRIVDVSDSLRADPTAVPHAVIKREVAEGHLATRALIPAGTQPYRVLEGPLDGEHSWSLDKAGSHVSVSMRPYVFGDKAEQLVQFGLQFGALAATSVGKADKVFLLMSTIFGRPDNQPGYCVYVGAAIRQE
jgi:hypothetical protein